MLFQISEAEPKPQIPAYTQDDDLGFKMSPFEQCWPVPVHKPQAYQAPSPALQHCRREDIAKLKPPTAGRGFFRGA